MNEEQKKKIQEEIQPVIAQLYEAAAHVDTIKLYEVFSFAHSDFTYIETTGAFYDEAAYKKMVRQFYGMLMSEIIQKGREKYIHTEENNVLWSYSGALTAIFKNGQQAKYEPFGMTLLFRKINDKWKVVFLQESTQEPAQANTETKNNSPMNKEKLTSFGKKYASAWCSQNPANVAGFFSTNGSLKVNTDLPAVGREAITKVAQGFMSAFPDMIVAMDSMVTKPNGTEFHWTLTGTNSGVGGTGNKVKISGFEVWRFDGNGLIQESIGSFDADEYNRQLKKDVK